FAHTRIDPRHLRAVDEAAAQLSAAGYPVEEIKPYPTADVTFEAFRHIFTSRLAGMDAGEGYFEWVRQQGLKVSQRMLADALRLPSYVPPFWPLAGKSMTSSLPFLPIPRHRLARSWRWTTRRTSWNKPGGRRGVRCLMSRSCRQFPSRGPQSAFK